MLISEQEFEAYIPEINLRDEIIPSTGESVKMPLICPKDSIGTTTWWSVSRSELLKLLPTPEIVPIELSNDRAMLTLAVYEFVNRPIPAFNEVAVGVPVFIGRDKKPPTLKDFESPTESGILSFRRHLIVNSRLAQVVGNDLLGCNKFMSQIGFETSPEARTCIVTDAGEEMLRLKVYLEPQDGRFDFERNALTTVCYKNGEFIMLTCPAFTKAPRVQPRKAELSFGTHPLGQMLAKLDFSSEPISVRHFTDVRIAPDVTDIKMVRAR